MAIEVFVQTSPVNIEVTQQVGVIGPAGPAGSSAAGDISGLISTGNADIRYYPLYSNPSGYITSSSVSISKKYIIPSGDISTGFIPFGYTFASLPIVVGNIVNNSGDPIIALYISDIKTSGFSLVGSAELLTNNYSYYYRASIEG